MQESTRKPIYFGWYVVLGAFVSQIFVVGFFTYSVSLIVPLVRDEFAVSMTEVMSSLTVGTFFGMLLLPLAGVMLDRLAVRWIMAAGLMLFALGIWLLAQSSSILQYTIIFGITMAVANAFAGSTACQTVVSRWFTSSRGKALGISAVGTSIGGIAVPALVSYWTETHDWRATLEQLSYLIALAVAPIVLLCVRNTPADIGIEIEGGDVAAQSTPTSELTLLNIIRHPSYWAIGIPLGLLFSVYMSILSNLTSYAQGVGLSAVAASNLIMIVAICGLIGKVVFGMAADKINLKVGLWAAMSMVLVAFLIFSSHPSYFFVLLGSVLLGLAAGGMLPVWGSMMARVFGLISYGRAMGLMGPLITIIVMPGFVLTGKMYDANGNYQQVLWLFSAAIIVAAVILIPLKLQSNENH